MSDNKQSCVIDIRLSSRYSRAMFLLCLRGLRKSGGVRCVREGAGMTGWSRWVPVSAKRCRRFAGWIALGAGLGWVATAGAQGAAAQVVGADPAGPGTQCYSASAADAGAGISFDVVSIKPDDTTSMGPYGVTMPPDGDNLDIDRFTTQDIVQWAYHLVNAWRDDQYDGAPKWFDKQRYDIRAKVAASDVEAWRKLDKEARRQMLRKVLAERFHLACHFAVVENQPVYNLVVAKGGLKIKEAKPGEISPYKFHVAGDPSTPYAGPGITLRPSPDRPNHWISVFQQLDMTSLVNSDFFSGVVDRPVIDKTGLKGAYNYSLDFDEKPLSAAPGPEGEAAKTDSPDIFVALPKQVGLKLEAGRGPVRHLVIDHVERPLAD